MTKRNRMKRQARELATARGHTLGRFSIVHSECDVANCSQCGATAYVNRGYGAPMAISGNAIRYNCCQ